MPRGTAGPTENNSKGEKRRRRRRRHTRTDAATERERLRGHRHWGPVGATETAGFSAAAAAAPCRIDLPPPPSPSRPYARDRHRRRRRRAVDSGAAVAGSKLFARIAGENTVLSAGRRQRHPRYVVPSKARTRFFHFADRQAPPRAADREIRPTSCRRPNAGRGRAAFADGGARAPPTERLGRSAAAHVGQTVGHVPAPYAAAERGRRVRAGELRVRSISLLHFLSRPSWSRFLALPAVRPVQAAARPTVTVSLSHSLPLSHSLSLALSF